MNNKNKKFFWLFFTLSLLTGVLLIVSYLPRSWGLNGIRNFFDFIENVSGSMSNPGAIGWIGLELFFIFTVIATIHFYGKAKRNISFYDSSLPMKTLVLRWGITFLLGSAFIMASHYLEEYTYFL